MSSNKNFVSKNLMESQLNINRYYDWEHFSGRVRAKAREGSIGWLRERNRDQDNRLQITKIRIIITHNWYLKNYCPLRASRLVPKTTVSKAFNEKKRFCRRIANTMTAIVCLDPLLRKTVNKFGWVQGHTARGQPLSIRLSVNSTKPVVGMGRVRLASSQLVVRPQLKPGLHLECCERF